MEYCLYHPYLPAAGMSFYGAAAGGEQRRTGKEADMTQVQVLINAPEKAERLCNILGHYRGPFDLTRGNRCVDGKSILGVYAMDLSAPLTLSIYNDEEPVIREIQEFICS